MLLIAFDKVVTGTMDALKNEGSGVITEIDVKETLKRIRIDFPSCRFLGAYDPVLAYEALRLENKVGTMLPPTSWSAMPPAGKRKCPPSIQSHPCRRSIIQS